MRFQQPYGNHNGGMIGFNTTAAEGSADYGLLYVGNGDGGSGGDPNGHSQDLANGFGKVFRIDPLGRNSRNKRYGIPSSNPFANDGNPATLDEIFAYGVRNPQQFAWDKKNGRMFLTDIGQNIVEELDTLSAGANLGWNTWEGSFGFGSRGVSLDNQRGDRSMTFPIAEYAQTDSLLQSQSAASGLVIYRGTQVPALTGRVLWCDLPSGELFYVSADDLPNGGQSAVKRILLNDGGTAKTLLVVISDRNSKLGKDAPRRVDLRIGEGANGDILLLNKADGVIRKLAP
jgi:glucose/arabinose dehydrogenase